MQHNLPGVTLAAHRALPNNTSSVSDDEIMGKIVVELLESGKTLNRKALCSKLLCRIETAASQHEIEHYQHLIRMVLERDYQPR